MARVGKGDLREQLEHTLQGRVCLMGVGNPEYGDDALRRASCRSTARGRRAGRDRCRKLTRALGRIRGRHGVRSPGLSGCRGIGCGAGSVVFLDSQEITARYPQISTHKISLGVLANVVESSGFTRAWLLGVQPASLKEGQDLTPTVRRTLGVLLELLLNRRTEEMSLC